MNLKNTQATPAAQFQKNKWPSQKMGQRTKQTFLEEDIQMPNKHMKNAQHHSLSEKCRSKPQWSTISRQSEWLQSKSLQAINAGEGVEKREPSYTVGGNANQYSHYGEQCGDSLKKMEIELPYDPEIPLLGMHTEKTEIERDTCTPMFIAVLFIIART